MNVFGGILESACLTVHPCVHPCVSVCVQNTSICQSAGRGIKSHLVTAVVLSGIVCAIYLPKFYQIYKEKNTLNQKV